MCVCIYRRNVKWKTSRLVYIFMSIIRPRKGNVCVLVFMVNSLHISSQSLWSQWRSGESGVFCWYIFYFHFAFVETATVIRAWVKGVYLRSVFTPCIPVQYKWDVTTILGKCICNILSLLHSVYSVILICVYIGPLMASIFVSRKTAQPCTSERSFFIRTTEYCITTKLCKCAVVANCVHHCVHPSCTYCNFYLYCASVRACNCIIVTSPTRSIVYTRVLVACNAHVSSTITKGVKLLIWV